MSTVQDEAEVGRVQSTNDEESEADGGPENDENRPVGGIPIRTLQRPYKEEKGEEEEQEDTSLNAAGTSFRSYERHDLDMQGDSSLASSPALGRPSSADGSLSIPDDTPSIQVATVPHLPILSLIEVGFQSVFSKQTRPFILIWSKPYAIAASI